MTETLVASKPMVEKSKQGDTIFDQLSTTMRAAINKVRSINEQTKTLAINARIEASRAGIVGAAFGVVAQEMLTLSKNTAQVANEIDCKTNEFHVIGENVRGTRLADLALNNIDLIDRNLYERTCDVRWWATDTSVVDALAAPSKESADHASSRMRVILNAYTVYFDLVLCDLKGHVIANGRPDLYHSVGHNESRSPWFFRAMATNSGDEYGFQTAHLSNLVNNQFSLVYSAAVRKDGKGNGVPLGVLGVVFNWQTFSKAILNGASYDNPEFAQTLRMVVDDTGSVVASSKPLSAGYMFPVKKFATLFQSPTGFVIDKLDGKRVCVAHARAPGFETYNTGWHSVMIQTLPTEKVLKD